MLVPKIAELKPRMSSAYVRIGRPSVMYLVSTTLMLLLTTHQSLGNYVFAGPCAAIAGYTDIQRLVSFCEGGESGR